MKFGFYHRHSKKFISIGVILSVGVVLTLLVFFNPAPPNIRVSNVKIQKAKVADLIENKDWPGLQDFLFADGSGKVTYERLKRLKHAVDTKVIQNHSDVQQISMILFDYMEDLRSKKSSPTDQKPLVIAGRILAKISRLRNQPQLDTKIQDWLADDSLYQSVAERYFSSKRTLPAFYYEKIVEDLHSGSVAQVNARVNEIQQLVDFKARRDLLVMLRNKILQLPAESQAMAFKVVILNEPMFENSMDLIETFSKRNDPRSQDAFLFAIEKSRHAKKYLSTLKKNMQDYTSQVMIDRAQSVLKRHNNGDS